MAAASAGALQSSAGTQLSVTGIQQSSQPQQQIQQQQQQLLNQNAQQHQRFPFLQRAGSGSQINIISGCNSSTASTVVTNQQQQQRQQGPNVAPGWRRQASNGDIVYVR